MFEACGPAAEDRGDLKKAPELNKQVGVCRVSLGQIYVSARSDSDRGTPSHSFSQKQNDHYCGAQDGSGGCINDVQPWACDLSRLLR